MWLYSCPSTKHEMENTMAFIRILSKTEVTGDAQEMYKSTEESMGELPNYVSAFCWRPDIMSAFMKLSSTVGGHMDRRRFELVMLAASKGLRSSYCRLAYGTWLREKFYSAEDAEAIARDYRNAGLDPADVAMMAYAEKVATDATTITQQDIDELHDHGFSDEAIFDIASAAGVRAFFTKVLAAVGIQPDASYEETLDPALYQALVASTRSL